MDYDFTKKPEHKSFVVPVDGAISTPLIEAGRRLGVLSLRGTQSYELMVKAKEHAKYQADRGVQGHQNWDTRVKKLFAELPEYNNFREICAESWPEESMEEAAAEMWKSWKHSPGHWSAANGECAIYGYSMAYNPSKRVWYACGIMADRREDDLTAFMDTRFGTPYPKGTM